MHWPLLNSVFLTLGSNEHLFAISLVFYAPKSLVPTFHETIDDIYITMIFYISSVLVYDILINIPLHLTLGGLNHPP